MGEGIGQRTIHKLSDFLSNESGRVGAKSALAMGGLVGAAALTQMMFAPEAQAHSNCDEANDCVTGDRQTCCCSHIVKDSKGNEIRDKHCMDRGACVINKKGGRCV